MREHINRLPVHLLDPLGRENLGRRPGRDHPTKSQERQPVGMGHRGIQIMQDDGDGGASIRTRTHQAHDVLMMLEVEGCGRLIEQLNNARVELAGDTGYIVFDIIGTTQGGEMIDQKGVRFVEFSLADATNANGVVALEGAATTLTEAGSAAFGTYPAGETFDPVSFSIPVGADCGVASVEEDAETTVVAAAVEPISTEGGFPVWAWNVIGLLVVGAGVGTGVVIQRRRGAASAETSED